MKKISFFLVFVITFSLLTNAQISTVPSNDIFDIQESTRNFSNYFEITHHFDSLIDNRYLTDGAEVLLSLAGLNNYTETFVPLSNLRKTNNKPPAGSITLKNKTQNTAMVYPNPSNGVVTVNYQLNNHGSIIISNLTGKVLLQKTLPKNNHSKKITLNLSAGVYLYQILVNQQIVNTDKLIITNH